MLKRLQSLWLISFLVVLNLGIARGDEPRQNRRVMTWVPPYAVTACKGRLNETFGGIGMMDGVTHVGLQFWKPSEKGGVKLVERFGKKVNEKTIAEFREWGKRQGVQVMLCVYNGSSSGWDWGLAQSAFATHRAKFIEVLVSETLRLGLDGVDIDFEGKGRQEKSREPFVRFIKDLSARLHAEGKELTVDTFAYKWNAPNQSWWPGLLPHVDGLHVMGYSETGAGASDWRSYDFMMAAAGRHTSKLLIGMASNASEWQERSVRKHLDWVIDQPSVGLAIWDAQLRNREWVTKETWQRIVKIKNGAKQGEVRKSGIAPNSKPDGAEKHKLELERRSR